ncbi:MAG: TIGR00153 family protein [Planctomycetes bacterium]|nr:TIGR00153 family protein [Planctomycetota bacterium]
MRSIARVFGRSPFIPLQSHMLKVSECVALVPELFVLYAAGDETALKELADRVSSLEHEADLVKHDIRDSMPRGLFMPVDRANLLNILTTQDAIANRAEDIAVLLTFKIAKTFEPFSTKMDAFIKKNMDAFDGAREIVGQLDELLETGFGGAEAHKVREMVHAVSKMEYEADMLQKELLRELFQHEDELSYGDFFLWTRIIRQVSQIADRSDNLATSIRTTLDSK